MRNSEPVARGGDPFAAESVTPGNRYFRLHGRSGWRYEYDEGELRELAMVLRKPETGMPTYVFFNNTHMIEDALRFRAITEETSAKTLAAAKPII